MNGRNIFGTVNKIRLKMSANRHRELYPSLCVVLNDVCMHTYLDGKTKVIDKIDVDRLMARTPYTHV